MRARVAIDSATTAEARAFARALRAEGLPAPRMHGEGPEAWSAESATAADLPSAADPASIIRALAAAYSADGAADAVRPTGHAAPVYATMRPTAAADTRAGLYWALSMAEMAIRGNEPDKAETHLVTMRDLLANLPE